MVRTNFPRKPLLNALETINRRSNHEYYAVQTAHNFPQFMLMKRLHVSTWTPLGKILIDLVLDLK